MAIPKEGYFKHEEGNYGPVFPRTPACYGFSVVAKVKPGREQAIRDYGKNIEEAVKADPSVLATLKLHYLRWVLFDIGSGLHFMYQGIFDTDFDKYLDDAVALFTQDRYHHGLRQTSKDGQKTGRRTWQRSSSSFAITSARASWSMESIPSSLLTKSRKRSR